MSVQLWRYLSMVNIILEKIISGFNSKGRGRGGGVRHFFDQPFKTLSGRLVFKHLLIYTLCEASVVQLWMD